MIVKKFLTETSSISVLELTSGGRGELPITSFETLFTLLIAGVLMTSVCIYNSSNLFRQHAT